MSNATFPISLRPVMRMEVNVSPQLMLGELGDIERRLTPIIDGSLSGPGFQGIILPGGSDIQAVRRNGTIELTARFAAELGELGKILIINSGIRRVAEGGNAQLPPYFRGVVRFDAPVGRLQWLNDSIFVSTGYRDGATVHLEVSELQ